jgi:hypothetical protein
VGKNNGNGFKPGQKRPPNAGRKKGTPNKKTRELVAVLDELNVNPVQALIDLIPNLEEAKQADVYLKLLEYVYPKRRAIEVSADDNMIDSLADGLTRARERLLKAKA